MEFLKFLADPRVYCGVLIPRVIEWSVVTIFVVFLLIVVLFVLLVLRNRNDIGTAIAILESQDGDITKQQLNELTDKFNEISTIKPMWKEFSKTIVAERLGESSSRVFATKQAEEFFTLARLVDQPMRAAQFLIVPGVMTSLGLLGTFLALFVGLNGLSVQPSGEVHGVDTFITGLSGKFVSSILGLFLAIFSLVAVRLSIGSLHEKAVLLQISLNKVFQRYPQESILLEMLRQLEDQSAAYKSFSADLAGQIKSSFHEDIGNLAETMNNSLAALNQNIADQGRHFRSFSDGLAPIVTQSMKEGLQPGVEAVQQSLGVLSTAAEELKAQKAESSQEMMEKLLVQFQQSLTGSTRSEFTKLSEVLSETATFSQQMNAQIRDFLSEMKAVMEAQQSGLSQHRSAMEESIARMMVDFDSLSTSQLNSIQERLSKVILQTEEWTESFRVALEERSGQQANQYESFVERMRKAQEDYVVTTSSSMNGVLESVTSHTAGVEASVLRLMELMNSHAQALGGLTTSLSSSAKTFDMVMTKNSTVVAQLKIVADTLQQAAKIADDASNALNSSTGNSSKAAERITQSLLGSADLFTRMQQVLKDHQALYSTLDEKISKATQQLSTALTTYNRVTSEGLNRHLTDFDSTLASACNRLGETVESIEGPIDELAEVISKAAGNLSR